uniref:Uncharacterized protein n=1 Tax=Anguilla anguilla TaxID=7936 RepID=A0A0E9T9R0_ANGAN
MSSAERVR